MPLILNNLSKSFGEKSVLDNFSLEASDKDKICIFGPSGGGKTTLLNIIAGLVRPDSGEIICDYKKIAYIFQEYRLLPWATAAENIYVAAGCDISRAEELMIAVELGNEINSYPDALSGGMKQRVNIARALACDSDLILMDEPFKELDSKLHDRIISVANKYCADRTVILVTHDRRDAELMKCNKIYEFH